MQPINQTYSFLVKEQVSPKQRRLPKPTLPFPLLLLAEASQPYSLIEPNTFLKSKTFSKLRSDSKRTATIDMTAFKKLCLLSNEDCSRKATIFLQNPTSTLQLTFLGEGNFHKVWSLDKDPEKVIKTLKGTSNTITMARIVKETLEALDNNLKIEFPSIRLVRILNRDTILKDGFYIYERVHGNKAKYDDVIDYLKLLVQAPQDYFIPDFRPDNVIKKVIDSEAGYELVMIDPSISEVDWEVVDWSKLHSDPGKWADRRIDLANQLLQWFKTCTDKSVEDLCNEFDQISFTDPNIEEFWHLVRDQIYMKAGINT